LKLEIFLNAWRNKCAHLTGLRGLKYYEKS
jgi:hypothetical protein